MKVALILWPITAFFALLLLLFVRLLIVSVLFDFAEVQTVFKQYVDALLIVTGQLFLFSFMSSFILNKFKQTTVKTKKLVWAITGAGFAALIAQVCARALGNGIASIGCADSCADTLYFAPGLTVATAATWIVLSCAFILMVIRLRTMYRDTSKPLAIK